MHLDFVEAAAYLRAHIYGISSKDINREAIRKKAASVEFPAFTPRSGVKIAASDAEASQQTTATTDQDIIDALIADLKARSAPAGLTISPHDFEKDDDSNHHIDFVAACANLRAANYEITAADRHHVKGVAGKIIPAIATTTALVSGLVALELYKILDGPQPGTAPESPEFARHWNLDRFKNGFVNLALPFFAFSSPLPAPKMSYNGGKSHFTLWDSIPVLLSQVRDLNALLELMSSQYGLTVTMLSCGSSLLYSSFLTKSRAPERLSMPLDQLVATVGKKGIPEHCDVLVLEALCEDADGNDIEIPILKLYLKK